MQYGRLLFCSRLLRDWHLFFVGNNSLTVAFTFFLKLSYLLHTSFGNYLLILPKIYFSFCCSLQFCTLNFSLAAVIAEKLVQMKYISELVSHPTPIVSTCRACECNVGGTPPISSIPLSALGVLDGDGLCSSSVKESL